MDDTTPSSPRRHPPKTFFISLTQLHGPSTSQGTSNARFLLSTNWTSYLLKICGLKIWFPQMFLMNNLTTGTTKAKETLLPWKHSKVFTGTFFIELINRFIAIKDDIIQLCNKCSHSRLSTVALSLSILDSISQANLDSLSSQLDDNLWRTDKTYFT